MINRAFGLIGYPLTHSFSANYFANKFLQEGIVDAQYSLFPLDRIDDFLALIKANGNLVGLNVTIPYKEAIIPYLDALDPEAAKIGACNCIHFKDGKRIGYNTDAIGFKQSLEVHWQDFHSPALVFGTGGASKAVCYVLRQLEIPYLQVSRQPVGANQIAYTDCTEARIAAHRLLINTTPLGTYPNTEQGVDIAYEGITSHHYCYDLVYNPAQTYFLRRAHEQGAITKNGSDMLVIQAEASWRIWNSAAILG
jgi:shikimate dehydrogenase